MTALHSLLLLLQVLQAVSTTELAIDSHVRVVTSYKEPFFFNVTSTSGETSAGGFIVDLLEKLKKELNFTYDFYLVPDPDVTDGKYGALVPAANGSGGLLWNGLMGEVVGGRADLAAADLTITPLRARDVAFTMPYTAAELGVLYQKRKNEFGWRTFLVPFTYQVWGLVLASLLATSLGLYMIARNDPEETSLRDLSCCVYFSVACLFAQGPETYPRTVATRVVAASWWFLCLMLLVVYTADLTSSFTIDKGELGMERLEDLLHLDDISFGIVKDTSIQETFQFTEYVPFQMMWSKMSAFPSVSFSPSHQAGIAKAREESNFVYITESPYLLYEVGRAPCVMQTFTGTNSPKTGGGLGFAFNKARSEWRDVFNVALIRLHQTGFLAENHRKWYDMRSQCAGKSNLNGSNGNIGLDKMEGIFVFFGLGMGSALAMFLAKRLAECVRRLTTAPGARTYVVEQVIGDAMTAAGKHDQK